MLFKMKVMTFILKEIIVRFASSQKPVMLE
jgi:hypothetical protein